MHDTARRLFIGEEVTRFTAEIDKATSAVVLNFSAPGESSHPRGAGPGSHVLTHEPLASGADKITLDDKTVSYTESNGAAEVSVSSPTPLLATFSNSSRIALVSAPMATPPPVAITPAPPLPPVPPPAPVKEPAPAAAPVPRGRTVIVLDAAHGGDERGAALTEKLAEKDVTLRFCPQAAH